MPDTTTKQVSLRKLAEPKFITITKKPANRTGFKAIRSDNEQVAMRADHPLLSILLPDTVGESDAYDMMELFGLGDDYEVVKREDSDGYMLKRKDASSAATTTIDLGDGLSAEVDSGSIEASRSDGNPGIVMTGLEFEKEQFPELGDVQEWLRGKDVTFKEGGVEIVDGGFIVTRHDVGSDVEVKKVPIQDGVTAIIAQAERADIPASVIPVVSEYAYGNYGWGQIDFAAALADRSFTDASWESLTVLGRVLEEIMFYSGFSLEERKVLIERAAAQFVSWMSYLMDLLPEQTLVQIRSDIKNRKEFTMIDLDRKQSPMTEAEKAAEEAQRNDANAQAATAEDKTTSDATAAGETAEGEAQRTDEGSNEQAEGQASAASSEGEAEGEAQRSDEAGDSGSEGAAATAEGESSESSDEPQFVTRSELEEVVNGAVESALAKREDGTTAALQGMQATMAKLVDTVADVKRSSEEDNKALQEKLEGIESTTVVRSDTDDAGAAEGQEKSVFAGSIFPGVHG